MMKKNKPKDSFLPSSCSSMIDPAPQPLFVSLRNRQCIFILRLETPANKRNTKTKVNLNEYVACFSLKELEGTTLDWIFSPPENSTSVMYIMPEFQRIPSVFDTTGKLVGRSVYGFEFNISNGECRLAKSVTCAKLQGLPVYCRGQLYVMACLPHSYNVSYPTFECYDPDQDKWKALIPIPPDATLNYTGENDCSVGIAVWGDTILYKLEDYQLWAYNVRLEKWYRVQARDVDNEDDEENRCYTICGRAIVIENNIYALSSRSMNVILELSIQTKGNDDDLVYICSLSLEMLVPGIGPPGYMDGSTCMWTRDLVDLGNDNFCIVQSSLNYFKVRFKPIYVAYLKLNKELEGGGKSMTLTNRHTYEVEVEAEEAEANSEFGVDICFSVPKYKTMCKTEQGKLFNFKLDCMYNTMRIGERRLSNFKLDPESEASTPGLDKKGNLPPEAPKEQLVKELQKFGPVNEDGIRVNKNETTASTIKIGGGCAEIEEWTVAAT